MLAYHNNTAVKTAIMAQLQAHHDADELVKGQYWENGEGCAVGCTIHGRDHSQYEPLFGIPEMLARLEDAIFEGLPNGKSKAWPMRFMGAIKPGTDLSRVGWKFLYWLLTDETVNPGINHPLVRDAVKQCALVVGARAEGKDVSESAAESARSAAWSAAGSAGSAAGSAGSAAWSAAWSARSAAESAWSAAESAWNAAESAAESARSAAGSAAWNAAYVHMSEKLIELLEAA